MKRFCRKKQLLGLTIAMAMNSGAVYATVWTEVDVTANSADYLGSTGSITFDDWGYSGPGGRNAMDFNAINGFGNNALDPTGGIGQIQHVVTKSPDWNTPDAAHTAVDDLSTTPDVYTDANVDSTATFYQWAYTSPAGSTFNNMNIDYDGDYLVAKDDMSFNWYNMFNYRNMYGDGATGTTPDGDYAQSLAFQPYALTDATGWCGSVMTSHPNALEAMAGQVTFDFAFDVYFRLAEGVYTYSSTEIVRGFKMRSYGDVFVNVTNAAGDETQTMSARAVVNNTNPDDAALVAAGLAGGTAPVDEDWHNEVSFMGAGILDDAGQCGQMTAEWAGGARGPGVKKFSGLIDAADAGACSTAGGTWQTHAYTRYAFILRADGDRIIDYFDEEIYGPDPYAVNPVPVPAAVWLFGSGLIGLAGLARRKK